jgi:hypothetical protein
MTIKQEKHKKANPIQLYPIKDIERVTEANPYLSKPYPIRGAKTITNKKRTKKILNAPPKATAALIFTNR